MEIKAWKFFKMRRTYNTLKFLKNFHNNEILHLWNPSEFLGCEALLIAREERRHFDIINA